MNNIRTRHDRLVSMSLPLLCAIGIASTGCSRHQNETFTAISSAQVSHFQRRIELGPQNRRDDALGIELIRVETDGSVTILLRSTGEILRASVGGYFGGREETIEGIGEVKPFGEHGLQVMSSDPERQMATIVRYGSSWE